MKTLFLLILLPLAFVSLAFSQSIKITEKKTTYKRPKPLSEYKKTFTVTRPIVSKVNAGLKKIIENSISFEKNFDLNIKEEQTEIQWLEEAYFEVKYNQKGLLDIDLTVSGSGAYPSVYTKTVVINLKTGKRLTPTDVFVNLPALANKVKKAQQAEIIKAKAEIKKDPDSQDLEVDEIFKSANFTTKNLSEFSVNEKGVTFIYDYSFPHVILALQPEGRYFYTWKQLKGFVKPSGLLGKFIK